MTSYRAFASMCRYPISTCAPLAAALLALGPRAVVGGNLFNKVAHVVKDAAPKGVENAFQDAVKEANPKEVEHTIKHMDPEKAASEALKRSEASKAAGALGAKVAVTVEGPKGDEAPATTTSPPLPSAGPPKESVARNVEGALQGSGLAKMLRGQSHKALANVLKETTPKKVVDALNGAEAKKVSEVVGEDTGNLAHAVQDATPKDVVEALNGGASSTGTLAGATDAFKGGAKEVGRAIQEAEPKQIASAAQGAAGAVQGVGPATLAKTLEETSPQHLAAAARGRSGREVVEAALRHPTEQSLRQLLAAAVGARGAPDGQDDTSSPPTSFNWVLLMLLPIAASVLGGWFVFVRLTRPKHVGVPMLAEPNGTEVTPVMPAGSWAGMGGASARDFRSQQPAQSFQRF